MTNRRWVIAVCSLVAVLTALAIFTRPKNSNLPPTPAASASTNFRNSLCKNSDCWYSVTVERIDGSGQVQAGGLPKEYGERLYYYATLEPNGDVTVMISGPPTVAAQVSFPAPERRADPTVTGMLPKFAMQSATEFAGKLVEAFRGKPS
jgi:hypothetical protein